MQGVGEGNRCQCMVERGVCADGAARELVDEQTRGEFWTLSFWSWWTLSFWRREMEELVEE